MTDKTPMTAQDALRLAISALNQIPNSKNSEYGNTYKLIPALGKALAQSATDKTALTEMLQQAEHWINEECERRGKEDREYEEPAFEMVDKIRAVLKNEPIEKKSIIVTVEGGLVQDITGIPSGYEVHVHDKDDGDTSHPTWNEKEGYFVSVYSN